MSASLFGGFPDTTPESITDLYLKAQWYYPGPYTAPVLWDTAQQTIVKNSSREIMRMFNTAFNEFLPKERAELNFYPEEPSSEIKEINQLVKSIRAHMDICGSAETQSGYERHVRKLFQYLDSIEWLLSEGNGDYLLGKTLTEADICLYTVIIRFDAVYVEHFKCNLLTIRHNYPSINTWLKNLYWNHEEFKRTTKFDHIKAHYYWSHARRHLPRIIPVGPDDPIEPL